MQCEILKIIETKIEEGVVVLSLPFERSHRGAYFEV